MGRPAHQLSSSFTANMLPVVPIAFLAGILLVSFASGDEYFTDFQFCGEDSVSSSVSLQRLAPHMFHDICPEEEPSKTLGYPRCGDGSPFGFFVSRPPQKYANEERILIETCGGGACWYVNSYVKLAFHFEHYKIP